MKKKYYDFNQCVYCGRRENGDPSDRWGWFGVDDDGDKVCPKCFSKIEENEDKK
jgi:hypothetical protein